MLNMDIEALWGPNGTDCHAESAEWRRVRDAVEGKRVEYTLPAQSGPGIPPENTKPRLIRKVRSDRAAEKRSPSQRCLNSSCLWGQRCSSGVLDRLLPPSASDGGR